MNKKQTIISSKKMHNINAYRYLCALNLPLTFDENIPEKLLNILNVISKLKTDNEYLKSEDYALLFSQFYESIEENHGFLENKEEYYDLIISIYENNNSNLTETYQIIESDGECNVFSVN